MKCPACGREPVAKLLESPCVCGHKWIDTAEYVGALSTDIGHVDTVLDIGCGDKGIIAQHYWESTRVIQRGFACDRFVIKPLPKLWTPILDDAEFLPRLLPLQGVQQVDVTTHCGLLEHLPYEKAFCVLRAVELVSRKLVFFTCSTELRQVDYKVQRDGNPYHYYRSFWDAKTFELLGYTVDRKHMAEHRTFNREVVGWFHPSAPCGAPWRVREARAKAWIAARRCCVPGCNAEPLMWCVCEGDACYCLVHHAEKFGAEEHDVKWWLDCKDIEKQLAPCIPPWRAEKLLSRLDREPRVESTKSFSAG